MEIQLKNIFKSYKVSKEQPEQEVLKNLDLKIKSGNRLAIIGPSGSGKTTLLNIIGTLDQADKGDVLLNEKNIRDFSSIQLDRFRNQNIGFVFQSHHLLPQLTAIDNILLPTLVNVSKDEKAMAYQRAITWLEKLGLKAETHKFPSQLSGGESQRVAVIRSLINNPEIILADEPTGSLDAKSSENLASLLVDISKEENISLLVVTHSLKLAEKMESVKELRNGLLI